MNDHGKCPVCESPGPAPFMVKFGVPMLKCPNCASVYMDPDAGIAVPAYEEDYFRSGESISFGFTDYQEMTGHFRHTWIRDLDILETMVKPPGRLLDVGAAMGDFVALANERGWTASGIEVSGFATAKAREKGLDVAQGDLMKTAPGAPFDAVTMLDTLEHTYDPAAALKRAASWLRPGGALLLTVPDYQNPVGRVMGRKWFGFNKVREHPFYFSRRGLKILMARCGLDDVVVKPWGWWTSGAYILDKAGTSGGFAGMAARLLARVGFIRNRTFNFRFINMMALGVRIKNLS